MSVEYSWNGEIGSFVIFLFINTKINLPAEKKAAEYKLNGKMTWVLIWLSYYNSRCNMLYYIINECHVSCDWYWLCTKAFLFNHNGIATLILLYTFFVCACSRLHLKCVWKIGKWAVVNCINRSNQSSIFSTNIFCKKNFECHKFVIFSIFFSLQFFGKRMWKISKNTWTV